MPFALAIGALATDADGGVLVGMHGFLFIQALPFVILLIFLFEKGEENVQFFIELCIFVVRNRGFREMSENCI
ncbi:glycerol kinase [Lysinibacillus fusiformis]|uniref:glycerol kinase n=1 Tax=Lysinibacillus fusiformis TaxID=28031 RepID=UPI0011BB0D37|nr:glycerol kinase [Lysinibacillus fusiformis]KAB0445131.1 glycerol kinase [Lysinibacillus fusiformis]QDZ97678.1 glycerol kinase [Lysinibacillus fusiformis]